MPSRSALMESFAPTDVETPSCVEVSTLPSQGAAAMPRLEMAVDEKCARSRPWIVALTRRLSLQSL